MTRILALLAALTLAACGSASTAGPKISNPPLKKEPPTAKADPAEKPAMEQDGMDLKFNPLGFKVTMTPSPWKAAVAREDGGSLRIVLLRPDIEAVLVLIPVHAPGESAKSIAENQQAMAGKEPGVAAGAVAAENGGRYAFTAERTDGQDVTRAYLGVLPHPSIPDAYVVGVAQAKAPVADAFLAEVRAVLDSAAPL
jgi:hypothetical protein